MIIVLMFTFCNYIQLGLVLTTLSPIIGVLNNDDLVIFVFLFNKLYFIFHTNLQSYTYFFFSVFIFITPSYVYLGWALDVNMPISSRWIKPVDSKPSYLSPDNFHQGVLVTKWVSSKFARKISAGLGRTTFLTFDCLNTLCEAAFYWNFCDFGF